MCNECYFDMLLFVNYDKLWLIVACWKKSARSLCVGSFHYHPFASFH